MEQWIRGFLLGGPSTWVWRVAGLWNLWCFACRGWEDCTLCQRLPGVLNLPGERLETIMPWLRLGLNVMVDALGFGFTASISSS